MTLRTPRLGASLIALGLSVSVAEGKAVSYEIDGQRYTYDSHNRGQAALARKRMSAAKAASAIRAKAAEERAANPLVRVFGSKTQNEAKAADAQLQELLAKGSSAIEDLLRDVRGLLRRQDVRRLELCDLRKAVERVGLVVWAVAADGRVL